MAALASSTTEKDKQQIQNILDAAGAHDNGKLEKYLKDYKFDDFDAVDAQNEDGVCPLHAAIASCAPVNGESASAEAESKACDTVRLLLENGAIWNQLNKNDDTPGCIAFKHGLFDLYGLMVDAGVRAEILLNRLEGYEALDDEGEDEDDTDMGDVVEDDDEEAPKLVDSSVQAATVEEAKIESDVNSTDYLDSKLSISRNKLLDDKSNGVMMDWESGIMEQSVNMLLTRPALKILNIGAGMLIFDTFVQESQNKAVEHHIVEAHPDVLADIKAKGWNTKPGVVIHEGKWQDILPTLIAQNITFDAIYYDTFAESYNDFKEFFQEYVLGLLDQDGQWSFFNGMGADRQISYDVYQKVVELDLFEAGFDIEWTEVEIPDLTREWEGVKRKYWNIQMYRLPLCKFMG